MLNKDMLLTGDDVKTLRQWKVEGDNLKKISEKQSTHNGDIIALLNMGDGFIASCSSDHSVKIW